jgi:Flp pilus assembly protein TadD
MVAACERAPEEAQYRIALAVAQYRLGRFQHAHYAETLATLARCDPSHPATLAFQAMAEHQLGQREVALSTLIRLRKVAKQPPWSGNADAVGFLREAEALIEGSSRR